MWRLVLLLLAPCLGLADQIEDVVRQVAQPNYTNYLVNLLYTRAADSRALYAPQHELARDHIRQAFERFGLATTLHPFLWQGGIYYNVVAVLEGKVRPGEYHVVGAHYDSTSRASDAPLAPGADDNASGVAALLETARVLSMQDLETSVVFIAFDREEQGLVGSRAWAAEHSADRILSMIAIDMIGYNAPGDIHNLVAMCGPTTGWNATQPALARAVATYGRGLRTFTACTSARSDHEAFAWLAPSVLLIEAGSEGSIHYHRSTDSVDTPDYIDFAFGTSITRSLVGYLATYAGLLPQPEGLVRLTGAGIANSASWVFGPAAPSQFLTLLGSGLTVGGPPTTVTVTDAAGIERPALLTYTSPGQINLVLPDGLALGAATLMVERGDGVRLSAVVPVESAVPGFFSADATGTGPAAAQAIRTAPDGTRTAQDLFACASTCSALPIEFGADDDRVVLVFYATGLRGHRDPASLTATIGGRTLAVEYAGPHAGIPGLDQVNVPLPRDLRGGGEVPVTFELNGQRANTVVIHLGPAM